MAGTFTTSRTDAWTNRVRIAVVTSVVQCAFLVSERRLLLVILLLKQKVLVVRYLLSAIYLPAMSCLLPTHPGQWGSKAGLLDWQLGSEMYVYAAKFYANTDSKLR